MPSSRKGQRRKPEGGTIFQWQGQSAPEQPNVASAPALTDFAVEPETQPARKPRQPHEDWLAAFADEDDVTRHATVHARDAEEDSSRTPVVKIVAFAPDAADDNTGQAAAVAESPWDLASDVVAPPDVPDDVMPDESPNADAPAAVVDVPPAARPRRITRVWTGGAVGLAAALVAVAWLATHRVSHQTIVALQPESPRSIATRGTSPADHEADVAAEPPRTTPSSTDVVRQPEAVAPRIAPPPSPAVAARVPIAAPNAPSRSARSASPAVSPPERIAEPASTDPPPIAPASDLATLPTIGQLAQPSVEPRREPTAIATSGIAPSTASPSVDGRSTPRAAAVASAVTPTVNEEARVRQTLARYRDAYSALDAAGAKQVWPGVDARALSRAFSQLQEQTVEFTGCSVSIDGRAANAVCNGTQEYVQKVGSRTPHVDWREWRFSLSRNGEEWTIRRVDLQ